MARGGHVLAPFTSPPGSPHWLAYVRQKLKNYLLLRKNPYVMLKKREGGRFAEKLPSDLL